MKQKELAG